jgi:pyridoxine 4-dehydrogenase
MQVAPIGAGTWAWGNRLLYGYKEAEDAALGAAFRTLVSRQVPLLFDTADSYGTGDLAGRSELLLGQFSSAEPNGRFAVMATKLAPYPTRLTAQSFLDAARQSSGRLRRMPIDVAQAHWSTNGYAPWQESPLLTGLGDMQLTGVARAIGVSNYGPKALRRAHAALAARGVRLASAQVQYSLLSRLPERNGLFEVAAELGIRVLAYSPLCLGLLTGRYDERNVPPGPRGLLFRTQAGPVAALLATLREVAAARGVSPSQVAIQWTRARGTLPIAGIRTERQAQEVLQCMDWQLTAAEVAELDAASERCPISATQNPFSVP